MAEQEEPKQATEVPLAVKRNWWRMAVYFVILLLLLSGIAGIIAAATSVSVDPASVKPPVTTLTEIENNQKQLMTPVPQPQVEEPKDLQGEEAPKTEILPTQQQTDAPLELPSKKNDKPLTHDSEIAPQSMIHLPSAPIVEKPVAKINGKALQIAIVIDDMGLNMRNSNAMASMSSSLTLAYMPYASNLHAQVKNAYENGHELIVHMPMEPDDLKHNNPGPDALLSTNSAEENVARLNRNLAKFDGYVIGMNNHMGSRMTSNAAAMRPVLQAFKEKGLWFLDSRTIGNSVGGRISNELGVPYVERDVFLDNSENVSAILAQLKQVESIARRKGYAVAIGHPYNQTIEALKQWLPQARAAGYRLVPLSTIISERFPTSPLPKYARTEQKISVAAH